MRYHVIGLSLIAAAVWFIPAGLAAQQSGEAGSTAVQHTPAADSLQYAGDPYPLASCPVTGELLGEGAVEYVHGTRHLRFSSTEALTQFTANPEAYLPQVDAQIIADQMPWYPLDTCLVSGEPLGSMGEPQNLVWNNRLVRFCCAGCFEAFKDDPQPYLAELDEAVVDRQGPSYPLNYCLVAPGTTASATTESFVMANRLFRLCCTDCSTALRTDAATWIALHDSLQVAR